MSRLHPERIFCHRLRRRHVFRRREILPSRDVDGSRAQTATALSPMNEGRPSDLTFDRASVDLLVGGHQTNRATATLSGWPNWIPGGGSHEPPPVQLTG